MGYQDEQFFGLEGPNSKFISPSDITNPDFKFTDRSRVVRTVTNINGVITDSSKKLERGFIRNILTDVNASGAGNPFEGTRTRLRCNFQFNPQDIEQFVEARRDMYLPILQDPSQFTQPIAGNTSFRFELIFDRTAEVNRRETNGSSIFNGDELTSVVSDPRSVGVLADLRILHAIIGQGFNKDGIEAQVTKFISDARRYARSNFEELNLQVDSSGNLIPENVGTDDNPIDNPSGKQAFDYLTRPGESTTNFINTNIGNSAILLPQPVRVVFSALFMVDGFIMSSQIMFTKFSRTLIPIQCKVVLNMQAVYLGFAKQKTFLQDQLQKADQKLADDWYTANQALESLKSKIGGLRVVNVGLFTNYDRLINDNDMNVTFKNPDNDKEFKHHVDRQYPWMYASKNFWYDRGDEKNYSTYSDKHPSRTLPDGLPSTVVNWYKPYVGGENDNFNKGPTPSGKNPSGKPHFSIGYFNNSEERNLTGQALFVDLADQNTVFGSKIHVNVYGMFDSEAAANTAASKISSIPQFEVSKVPPTGSLLMGRYYSNFPDAISTLNNWNEFIGGFGTFNATSATDTFVNSANDPLGGRPSVVSNETDIYNRRNRAPVENCITPSDVYLDVNTALDELGIDNESSFLLSKDLKKKVLLNLFADERAVTSGSELTWASIHSDANPTQRAVDLLFPTLGSTPKKYLIENESILQHRYTISMDSTEGVNSLLPFAHNKFKDKWFIFDVNIESSISFTPSGNVTQTIKSSGSQRLVVRGSDWGRTISITTSEWK